MPIAPETAEKIRQLAAGLDAPGADEDGEYALCIARVYEAHDEGAAAAHWYARAAAAVRARGDASRARRLEVLALMLAPQR